MTSTPMMPADGSAERIVRHFQAAGFTGITEALVVRIRLKKDDRMVVDAAFDRAVDSGTMPPIGEFFEIRPYGFYSELRSFTEARAAFQTDLGLALRREIPALYFDAAPVVIDDALATGTKYDAMIKVSDNVVGYALGILLNDPNSSFFEYLGSERGNDWQKIIDDFSAAATFFGQDVDLI